MAKITGMGIIVICSSSKPDPCCLTYAQALATSMAIPKSRAQRERLGYRQRDVLSKLPPTELGRVLLAYDSQFTLWLHW